LSIIETLVVFVGIPAAVIAAVTGLIFGGNTRRARRYRPGRPFEFRPVWFLAAPEQHGPGNGAGPDSRRQVSGANRLALTKAETAAAGTVPAPGALPDSTGGASDRW
jgi:hypothetical protein